MFSVRWSAVLPGFNLWQTCRTAGRGRCARESDRRSFPVAPARLLAASWPHPSPARNASGDSSNQNAWSGVGAINHVGHFPAAPGTRAGARGRRSGTSASLDAATFEPWRSVGGRRPAKHADRDSVKPNGAIHDARSGRAIRNFRTSFGGACRGGGRASHHLRASEPKGASGVRFPACVAGRCVPTDRDGRQRSDDTRLTDAKGLPSDPIRHLHQEDVVARR
jgi:hypothetical protein